MGAWNYRVLRHVGVDVDNELQIHAVHYDEAGQVVAVSLGPIYPAQDSIPDLNSQLAQMRQATQMPVLDYAETLEAARRNGDALRAQLEGLAGEEAVHAA